MMSLKFILFGALAAFVAGYEPDAPPVLVELFCDIDPPSCRWEMVHDLPDTYYALKETGIMNLYLNFYGKTEEPIGPGEFYEHRLAECAIFYNNNNDTLIEFFKCFMTEEHFPEASVDGKHCAESVGIDWSVLEGCYLSEEGEELLIKAGVKYHSMKPPVSLYPEYYINSGLLNTYWWEHRPLDASSIEGSCWQVAMFNKQRLEYVFPSVPHTGL